MHEYVYTHPNMGTVHTIDSTQSTDYTHIHHICTGISLPCYLPPSLLENFAHLLSSSLLLMILALIPFPGAA